MTVIKVTAIDVPTQETAPSDVVWETVSRCVPFMNDPNKLRTQIVFADGGSVIVTESIDEIDQLVFAASSVTKS